MYDNAITVLILVYDSFPRIQLVSAQGLQVQVRLRGRGWLAGAAALSRFCAYIREGSGML